MLELEEPASIWVIEAAVGTSRIRGRQMQVVRGKLTPNFFSALAVPAYQRVAMLNDKHHELVEALGPNGMGVPDDLMLCARSGEFRAVGSGEIILPGTLLYVLDGHQRYTAAIARLQRGQHTDDFGVKILLGATATEERDIFYQINRKQTRVSTHVHMRNSEDTPATTALKSMAMEQEGFPQVQWDQLKKPGDDITAHMLYELAVVLHGYAKGGSDEEIWDALDKTTDLLGTELLVQNVTTFFDIVKTCFIAEIKKGGKVETNDKREFAYRVNLLRALAAVFAGHENFWDPRNPYKLQITRDDLNKIRGLTVRTLRRDLEKSTAASDLYDAIVRAVDKLERRS